MNPLAASSSTAHTGSISRQVQELLEKQREELIEERNDERERREMEHTGIVNRLESEVRHLYIISLRDDGER
jgi:hypothetical protein